MYGAEHDGDGFYDHEPPHDDYPIGLEEIAGFLAGVTTAAIGLVWLLKKKLWTE